MKASDKRNRQQWVFLARQLLYTSSRDAACPECGKPALTVRDLEYGGGSAHGVVRYLSCSNCAGFDFVTLRRAGNVPAGRIGSIEMAKRAPEATDEVLIRQGAEG